MSFQIGTPIRRNMPLTMDQIRTAAPSAFAMEPYHGMSDRYAYLPTSAVIEGMMKNGFQVFAASQSLARLEDKQNHTKHMIRFRQQNNSLSVGDTFGEVVMVNSHDGSSTFNLMAGLFRLACSNGMVVSEGQIESLKVRHSGRIIEEVATGSMQIVQNMPAAIDAIARWKSIQLSTSDQNALAEAAHIVRFADSEGKVNTPIRPEQLLQTNRYADNGNDLWSTFNRVQENVIKGGLRARAQGATRRTGMREVKGIDQDVRLNRALWTLGERMAEIRG